MKRFLLTSLILILVPTMLFLPVYLYLVVYSIENAQDYSDDVQGEWSAFQYYYESQRVACNDEKYMSITFEDNTITIEGTVLPETETGFTWQGGTSLTYTADGTTYTYLISFDSNNNLKIVVDGTSYIIMLRRSGG